MTGHDKFSEAGSPIDYRVLNGVPNQVTLYAYPLLFHEDMRALLGAYAQDQWTVKKLTVTAGLRFDRLHGWVPSQTRPAGPLVPAFTSSISRSAAS